MCPFGPSEGSEYIAQVERKEIHEFDLKRRFNPISILKIRENPHGAMVHNFTVVVPQAEKSQENYVTGWVLIS